MLRKRLVGLLLLPLLTLIFLVGWVMYFVGDEKENNTLRPRSLIKTELKEVIVLKSSNRKVKR